MKNSNQHTSLSQLIVGQNTHLNTDIIAGQKARQWLIRLALLCLLTNSLYTTTLAQEGQRKKPAVQTAQQKAAQRQNWEQRGDSAIASRELIRMKRVFKMTPDQEQALFAAGIQMNQRRRQVIKTYGKTESLPSELKKVDKSADSLYQSIIGASQFTKYQDALHTRLSQSRQIAGLDTTIHPKPQHHEK